MPARAKTFLYGLGCFLLPIAILSVAAAVNNVYPFGTETFISSDMRTQYVDFFVWYRNALLGDADISYMTSQMLGNPMAATIGYYLASPLNLGVILFDQKDVPLFCFVAVLVKVGFIQLACVFYLRRRFSLSRTWACALSLGFSLSMWTLTEMRNVMWLDALILLPICAWAVCCLLRSGKWRLLALSYGLCLLTCWYTGYMVGLFLCFYGVFEGYVLGYEGVPSTGKVHIRRLLLLVGVLALGVALSAVVFVPSVLGIVNGAATEIGGHTSGFAGAHSKLAEKAPFLEEIPMAAIIGALGCMLLAIVGAVLFFARKRPFRQRYAILLFVLLMLCLVGCFAVPYFMFAPVTGVLSGLFLGSYEMDKTPQLYGSILLLLLTIWLFCLKRVPLKLKLAVGLFLFLMLLSSWVSPLQLIWCGFRLPAGHYSRTAFLFVFLLLWCGGYAAREILADPAKRSGAFFEKLPIQLGVLALVVVELVVRVSVMMNYQYGSISQELFDQYEASAISQMEELERYDPGVYRIKKEYWRLGEAGMNDGLWDGSNRIDSYTSTGDGNVLMFLSKIGCGDGKFCTYASSSPFPIDVLFGIKYMSTDGDPGIWKDAGFTPIELPEGAKFYETPYPLSLAYCVPASMVGFQLPEGDWAECLNAFCAAASGSQMPVYPNAGIEDVPDYDPAALEAMYQAVSAHQFTFEEFGGSTIRGSVEAPEGQVLLMTIPNQPGWEVRVNGQSVEPQNVGSGALMAIPVEPGANAVEMRFTPPGLISGAIITAGALLFIVLVPLFRKRKTAKDTGSEMVSKEAA